MKTLYLLRHAKSSWGDASLADHDRPLAQRGRKALGKLARYMERAGVRPELVLCSSAVRARQTYAGLAGALGHPELLVEKGLYGASYEELLERLREVPADVERVMLVGHNPGIGELATGLAGGREQAAFSQLSEGFPTGALATFSFDGAWEALDARAARLVDFAVPRDLEGGHQRWRPPSAKL